ncbi:zinc ribbon domain-containing protein [Ciceribacter ferrooxidans]|uniref:Zinc ribbon domain-containing protein n=1 Tax=Ciceribacter ferrooxidans TaxID=2509717 RepID=A0A4Q2SVP8_9HYPH|nr:zinc ribbon domain-containing protein [Ciceribacter ferrooxidans]RYC10145.1 zinc ribbon domain-containing protein [Ciceribacter ferrooxidans]
MATLLALIAAAFILNGTMTSLVAESALHQLLAATYIVGGFIMMTLALVAGRVARVVEVLAKAAPHAPETVQADEPQTMTIPARRAKAPDDSAANSGEGQQIRHMLICRNCGRENPPTSKLCFCGMPLNS